MGNRTALVSSFHGLKVFTAAVSALVLFTAHIVAGCGSGSGEATQRRKVAVLPAPTSTEQPRVPRPLFPATTAETPTLPTATAPPVTTTVTVSTTTEAPRGAGRNGHRLDDTGHDR